MSKKSTIKSGNSYQSYLSHIKWGESYTSLFLGVVVVIVAFVLIFSFFRSGNILKNIGSTSTNIQDEKTTAKYPSSYTVKKGDNLWSISEKIYGSGYNWVDLVKENKLSNPNILYVGTKLSVSNVLPKQTTIQKTTNNKSNPITGASYTVVKGDYLWEIAIRAYGDGFRWVEISSANKLSNPNLIHPGNKLRIPRK